MNTNLERASKMVDLSPKLAALCMPLFNQTPVSLYSYGEIDANGSFFLASTHKPLVEGMLTSQTLKAELVPYSKYVRNEGFFISDLHAGYRNDAQLFLNRLTKVGKGHECIFVDRRDKYCLKIHFFYGAIDDDSFNTFFLNNTTVMRCFSRYAENELRSKLSVLDPIVFPQREQKEARAFIRSVKPIDISASKFLLSLAPNKAISQRQWEIIYWYFMGKTSSETAIILGIKQTTVETHFIRIKEKLGCRTKQQIFREIFSHNDFWDAFGASLFQSETPE